MKHDCIGLGCCGRAVIFETGSMHPREKRKRLLLPASILAGGIVIAAIASASSVAAQTSAISAGAQSLAGIAFPVSELGNCASESECRRFCNDPSHIEACVSFAEAHGLMNKDDAERAREFSGLLQSGKTPGGCKDQEECQAFCSDTSRLDACLAFAKQLGIKDEHVAEGEKILAYLQSGGTMPGGCDSKDSCEAYCLDFDHASECLQFMESSGLGPPPDAVGPDGKPMAFDELKRIAALMKGGSAPGGCKNKDECEAYCKDSSHLDACLSFAVKAGFMTQEEAGMARKAGGKGPGGCDSEDSCKAFCDDPPHQQECFDFAEQHGLIPASQLQEMRQDMEKLRAGLDQAPPEVASCIRSAVGQDVLEGILAGTVSPGPEIGGRIQSCFEKCRLMQIPGA